ncbi:hypothetical protein [Algoriphagus boritolerans]|uniref:hypothetical protein n=1 Tax=Algoriphagus boritolerans TaxID=308111 RepID=UPI002FCE53E7
MISIESFTPEVKELAGAVCIWKPLVPSQDALPKKGSSSLKKMGEGINLTRKFLSVRAPGRRESDGTRTLRFPDSRLSSALGDKSIGHPTPVFSTS